MREDTIWRKKTIKGFRAISDDAWWAEKLLWIAREGKRAFDSVHVEFGRILAEAVMYMEREEIAGPDYRPKRRGVHKWASQGGTIYVGDQKIAVEHPRLRGSRREIELST